MGICDSQGDGKLAPAEFNAGLNLDNMVRREDGAIARKYCELIAWRVAFANARPVLHRKARKRHASQRSVSRGNRRKLIAAACAPEEPQHMAPWP